MRVRKNNKLLYERSVILCKGYIYLNTIYELLGLRWDPYDENICWIFERDGEPKISITPCDSCRKIRIDIFTKHQD